MNAVLGDLPTWNLADLYSSPTGTDLDADLKRAAEEAAAFAKDYEGKIAALDGKGLGGAIARYERLSDLMGRIGSYASLYYAQNMADAERGRFSQNVSEKLTDIGSQLVFFRLEINKIEDADLAARIKAPELAKYEPWLRDLRVYRPHQLSDEVEAILHDKSVTGARAWSRLFDQTIAELRFDADGESLTLADTLNRLDNPDAATRRTAAKALGQGLGARASVFTLIVNTLAKDKEVDDKWRKYPHPVAYRNLTNKVDDAVVEALVSAIREAYAELAHRYYRLKAGWFGRDSLDYWDRNAPLPGDDNRRFSWDEGREIVLDAFGGFDGRMAELAERFFVHSWIDGAPRPGKDPGAFCHPVVPSAHPYVLMNYYGRSRDVMTLAHELGHGVHQLLAAEQGMLMADTPLTLAETASVFGEMLVFRALLDRQGDPAARRRLLAGKVESMLNTVVRQTAFHEFEQRVHGERRLGELSSERLGEIWLDVQRESLGPVMRFDDEYQYYWAYIPHFIHSPFYVYAYAFGDCLVNSLYAVYRNAERGFQEKYFDMLRAGGTKHHSELLAPFGLDATDPSFWDQGLSVIGTLIDELETLDRA
ncbi:MAG: M3 family oligoendopeptidase [Proteobacteria bacterium]|nr:M3 family oligoendopeptidase [Pseudomonadota bacterium]